MHKAFYSLNGLKAFEFGGLGFRVLGQSFIKLKNFMKNLHKSAKRTKAYRI